MMRIARYLPAIILLAFVSCGDTSIFLAPVEETAKVQIHTIDAGEIVEPGSLIPVRIGRDPVFSGDPETADQLVVELLDTDGVLLGVYEYESVDQADDLPALVLMDVGDGLFVLRSSYFDGDELIESSEIPFFISRGEFAILGISSFPATLYPDSTGLLSLNMLASPGSDPYLEWFLDDEPVQSGLRSESGTTVEIRAPERTGAYTVSVNLYPVKPDFGEEPIPAFITHETELIVSRETVLDQSDLSPERSYYVLHHFLGDLRDSGARSQMFDTPSAVTRAVGDPSLAVESDVFGYRLDGDDGFELDGLILPVREGRLSPFSLSFRLRTDTVEHDMVLVEVETDARPVFRLEFDSEGFLTLKLGRSDATVSSPVPVISEGVTSDITVSVLPVDEQTIVHFYVNGLTVLSEVIDWNSADLPLPDAEETSEDGWMLIPGRTLVAGDEGFAGVLDEFGVYFRDAGDQPSADTEIFRSAMQQVYGEKLIYAEGFEADQIPETVEVDGPAKVDTGRLVLREGATAFFPLFGFSSEELFVTLSFEALPGSVLRFFAAPEEILIVDEVASELGVDGVDLEFRFEHREDTLLVISPDGRETEIDLSANDAFTGIRLEVSQSGNRPAAIAVESVLAWRENPEIPASLLEPRDGDRVESNG